MAFLIGSALAALLVTALAAKLVVARRPAASRGAQIFWSASSFPLLAVLLFAIATLVTLADGSRLAEPGGTAGMAVFAMVFFLFYALAVGVVVGIPTAIVAVGALRR